MGAFRRVPNEASRALTVVPVGEELTEMATQSTTDATFTTIWSYTLATDEFFSADAAVMGCRLGNTQGAKYTTAVLVRDNSGVTTVVGSVNYVAIEDDATWSVRWNLSGATIRLQVQGAAAVNIDWFARIDFLAQIV